MEKILEKIERYIIYAVVFLMPFAFAPISPNVTSTIKLAIILYGVVIALVIKGIRTIISGHFTWSTSKLDVPIIIIGFAYLLSTILRTPNKMEALLLPGTTTAIWGSILLYFLINQLEEKGKSMLKIWLFASGVTVSIIMLLSATGLFTSLKFLPDYLQTNTFNPIGGFLPSAIFLLTMLVIGIGDIVSDKSVQLKVFYGVSSVIVLFGLGLSVYRLTPGSNNPFTIKLPSLSTSWNVAIDSLKDSPLLGVGPGNYLTAFNRYRPLQYARTNDWNIKFSTANTFYLTLFTETGMLGLAGLILLMATFFKTTKQEILKSKSEIFPKHSQLVSSILLVLILFFVPASLVVMMLLFVLLAISFRSEKTDLPLVNSSPDSKSSRVPAFIIATPIIVAALYVFIKSLPVVTGEYYYRQALVSALTPNQAEKAYTKIQDAIRKNPYVDRYHATYSQINLALANSAAANLSKKNSEGGDTNSPVQLTDDEKNQLSALVQQAIREARSTVLLNPQRAGNWELLANTYRSIIPLAQGADVYASQSYAQAISLDVYNPNIRIARGQLHFAAKDYKNAVDIFSQAVAIKPDYANARYNLAFALKENDNIPEAVNQMTQVLALLDKDSADYETARKALDELEKQKSLEEAANSANTENLNAPQEAAQPAIEPQVELTTEDQPPAVEATPTPTPEENTNAEGTITPTTTEVTPTIIP